MKRLIAALSTVVALAIALFSTNPIRRVVVEGRSMLRAYAPGDRLLVESVTYRLRLPRIGEVVAVKNAASGRLDLKRIAAGPGASVMVAGADCVLGPDEWYVLGDNLDESQDSRTLGPVKTKDIVGRVWFRY
ncbi:MAG TPA: S26 family signal peptidase [Dehalococcoidia bacterium]|nr:S26 family signal peptidase [Dehalococcoidia bacterium]